MYKIEILVDSDVKKSKNDVAPKSLAEVSKGLVLWAQSQKLLNFDLRVTELG